MNDVYMARPPKIVIVLSVLPNWNKIVNQSVNQSICASQLFQVDSECMYIDDVWGYVISWVHQYIYGSPA